MRKRNVGFDEGTRDDHCSRSSLRARSSRSRGLDLVLCRFKYRSSSRGGGVLLLRRFELDSDRPRTGAVQGTSVGLLVFRGVPPTWLSSLSEGPARPLFRPVGVVQESSVGAWPLIFMGKVCSVGVYGSTTTSISASLTACESSEEGGELVMIDIEDPEPRPVSIE
jgi:hypothetical protein